MPLTKSGSKVLGEMKSQYGDTKGKQVFYASMTKGNPGSQKWHGPAASRRAVRKVGRG
jgi:hypothetical protein